MSALYKDKTLTDNVIYYDEYTIRVTTTKPLSLQAYKAFLLELGSYLEFIDVEVTAKNLEVEGEMRIFPEKQRINVGQSIYSVTIKTP
jgi:hypothetical protein